MWANGPVDLARRVVRRIFDRSGEGTWRRWQKLLRRTVRGRVRVGAPDERSGLN